MPVYNGIDVKVKGGDSVNIAIVDDIQTDLERYGRAIQSSFEKLKNGVVLYQYKSVKEMRSNADQIDVIFLDIKMPEMDGITFAKTLRQEHKENIIVFLSDYDSYVWDCFDVNAIYFMRKRYFDKEIDGIARKVIELYEKQAQRTIVIKEGKKLHPIQIDEVIYVEAQRKDVHIYTDKEEHVLKKPFREIEKQFGDYGFIKTHRSYMVNYRYVKNMELLNVEMENGSILPISKYRTEEVRQEYCSLLGNE